jgi:prevent-host-death family protein
MQGVPMINLSDDIDSLSNFKRHTAKFMEKMKETGRPVVLTINGKAEIVMQDAESYQVILDSLEFAKAVRSLRESLKDIREGKTQSVESVFNELL